jgi:hypothetical protein
LNPVTFLKTLRRLRRSHGKGVSHLTPAQLVRRWNGEYTIGTLANWRVHKDNARLGPSFVRVSGRVLYPIAGVELFESQMLALIVEGKRG